MYTAEDLSIIAVGFRPEDRDFTVDDSRYWVCTTMLTTEQEHRYGLPLYPQTPTWWPLDYGSATPTPEERAAKHLGDVILNNLSTVLLVHDREQDAYGICYREERTAPEEVIAAYLICGLLPPVSLVEHFSTRLDPRGNLPTSTYQAVLEACHLTTREARRGDTAQKVANLWTGWVPPSEIGGAIERWTETLPVGPLQERLGFWIDLKDSPDTDEETGEPLLRLAVCTEAGNVLTSTGTGVPATATPEERAQALANAAAAVHRAFEKAAEKIVARLSGNDFREGVPDA